MAEKPKISVPPALAAGASEGEISVELSSRRTGMSFQRTRMSADRTLMSVIRTALSLISFGFTIYQFFQHLAEDHVVARTHAARNFGTSLVYLGVAMVAVGLLFHLRFMTGLRRLRDEMMTEGLIHGQSEFPYSFTFVVAFLVLLLGIAAIASVSFNSGPFG
jgi:putative membrane protein